MDKNELLRRTRQFAIRVFSNGSCGKVVEKFPGSKAADVVAFQLLKASSSVAYIYSRY